MPDVSLDRLKLHYETFGAGPPLLLIAGTGSPHTSWMGQIPSYSEHFTCVAYDTRGIGKSLCEDRELTIKDLAGDALALLDHLGIDRCHIIGTSLGAATAQEICLAQPDRVARLVLHAPWVRTSSYDHLSSQFALRIDLIERGEMDLYEKLSKLWLFSPNYVNSSETDNAAQAQPIKSRAEWQGIARQFQANLGHDTRDRLAQISTPTLVTVGEDDFLVRPSYAKAVADAIAGSEFVVWQGVGHLARIEQPKLFTETTLSFLTK